MTAYVEDTYKGESPAKKLARLEFWTRAVSIMGDRAGRIAVLASREMGDYGVLSALGMAERVVAIDRCASAVEAAKSKYPSADVRHTEAATLRLETQEPIACAFLDFCSPICVDIIDTLALFAERGTPGDLLGVGFLKGREQDTERRCKSENAHLTSRRHRRALLSKFGEGSRELIGIATGTHTSCRGIVQGSIYRRFAPGEARARELALAVGAVSYQDIKLLGTIHYQSRTANSCGVPMTYALFRIVKNPLNRTGSSVERAVADRVRILGSTRAASFDVSVPADECLVRRKALDIESEGKDASLLLNIPRGTISAWKAHDTRGTYAEEAAE